ncbi:Cyclin-dependent kinase 1 [Taenia solium]|eukprot:TsM_000304800 transcript=TsM_000304800 gene=TsM_000304800
MYQILQASRYCHLRRIIYRYLTPQNVSIDVNRSVTKLADFGLSKSFGYPLLTLTHGFVTLLYRSPEILLGEAVDCCGAAVWSMGYTFVQTTRKDLLFRNESQIDKLSHTFRIKRPTTMETWPGVKKLPYYNSGLLPPWHANRLCFQEQIMRALDARDLDLLTHTLLHPHFANLDNRSLPVVGEEHVGLPIGRIPPDFSELSVALITITRVSATRDKSTKGKSEKSKTEEPLTENHNVNRSTTRRFVIAIIINPSAHSSPPFHYANYLLAPGTVTIIAVPVVQQ